jgi:hypothetical protein
MAGFASRVHDLQRAMNLAVFIGALLGHQIIDAPTVRSCVELLLESGGPVRYERLWAMGCVLMHCDKKLINDAEGLELGIRVVRQLCVTRSVGMSDVVLQHMWEQGHPVRVMYSVSSVCVVAR